ncbi:hypothetical protein BKA57DRAFT_133619 [Linnemannia elongata]|nr:hypothetical protein BKA57DRAFT_133619 [Linnemannia elongata]
MKSSHRHLLCGLRLLLDCWGTSLDFPIKDKGEKMLDDCGPGVLLQYQLKYVKGRFCILLASNCIQCFRPILAFRTTQKPVQDHNFHCSKNKHPSLCHCGYRRVNPSRHVLDVLLVE